MIIGLLPAAGKATRIGGIPKWLLPVPSGYLLDTHVRRMERADVDAVLIAAGAHNATLLAAYKPTLGRLYMGNSRTMSEDVLLARPITNNARILFGMPDTYFDNPTVYNVMRRYEREADVVLAVWRIGSDQRGNLGQVAFDDNGMVTDVVDKNLTCPYQWAWGAMLWNPVFWDYITPDMPHVGYAIMPAVRAGLRVKVHIVDGAYTDCGTPEAYWQLCATFVKEAV